MKKEKYNKILFLKIAMCFFAIFVYSKFTTLGDSFGYLSADNKDFEYQGVLTSTTLMYTVGHLLKRFLFFDVIASMPFIFLSYYGIKYLLNNFKVAFNKPIFFALIFIPNYLVYTSIISKEAVGSFYSSVIAVMIINYIEGNFKIKLIYLCSIALCFLFKPQFLIFIFEALFLLYATKKIRNNFFVAFLGSSIWAVNIISMYVFSEQINDLAKMMKYNFMMEDARSTRNTSIFDTQNAIFTELPYGIFQSFFGPTFSEMTNNPAHLLAGLESIFVISLFIFLIIKAIVLKKIDARIFWSYSLIFLGILMVHYPFGIFNPGSAIRYRHNFYLIFVALLVYLCYYKKNNNTINESKA
jgi:hypothetical protein